MLEEENPSLTVFYTQQEQVVTGTEVACLSQDTPPPPPLLIATDPLQHAAGYVEIVRGPIDCQHGGNASTFGTCRRWGSGDFLYDMWIH